MSLSDIYTGTITANSQTIVADTVSATGTYVIMYGTHAGITTVFEGTPDGGTTWIPIGARAINVAATSPTVLQVALGSNASAHYYCVVGACQQFRVRSSAFTSGTLKVSIQPTDETGPSLL